MRKFRKPQKKFKKRKRIRGRGKVGDTLKEVAVEGAKQAGSALLKRFAGAAAGGPVGIGIVAVTELMGRAIEKAVKADYTQSKRREFKKAWKPVKDKRGKKPNWLTGGWYAPKKNPKKNRYDEDYGFGTW